MIAWRRKEEEEEDKKSYIYINKYLIMTISRYINEQHTSNSIYTSMKSAYI